MQYVMPALQAMDELDESRIHGRKISPDRIYNIVLTITDDEMRARLAQSELMFAQMERIGNGNQLKLFDREAQRTER